MVDLQELGDLVDLGADLALGGAAGAQRARDVLERRHVGEQREVLERHADVARLGADADDRAAVDLDVAGIGLVHAGDQAQQDRLAGAGSAEDHDRLAALDAERDALEHRLLAESLGDLVEHEIAHRILLIL